MYRALRLCLFLFVAVQGLEPDLDLKRICKAMKRVFNCNGAHAAGCRRARERSLPAAALCRLSLSCREPFSTFFISAGSIEEDKEMGEIIQLQGDQRDNARAWILENEIVARADAELVRRRAARSGIRHLRCYCRPHAALVSLPASCAGRCPRLLMLRQPASFTITICHRRPRLVMLHNVWGVAVSQPVCELKRLLWEGSLASGSPNTHHLPPNFLSARAHILATFWTKIFDSSRLGKIKLTQARPTQPEVQGSLRQPAAYTHLRCGRRYRPKKKKKKKKKKKAIATPLAAVY